MMDQKGYKPVKSGKDGVIIAFGNNQAYLGGYMFENGGIKSTLAKHLIKNFVSQSYTCEWV